MWSWRGFRMVLDRKRRLVFQSDTGYCIVVQVYVGDFDHITFFDIRPVHDEAMVLGGDLTFSRK